MSGLKKFLSIGISDRPSSSELGWPRVLANASASSLLWALVGLWLTQSEWVSDHLFHHNHTSPLRSADHILESQQITLLLEIRGERNIFQTLRVDWINVLYFLSTSFVMKPCSSLSLCCFAGYDAGTWLSVLLTVPNVIQSRQQLLSGFHLSWEVCQDANHLGSEIKLWRGKQRWLTYTVLG